MFRPAASLIVVAMLASVATAQHSSGDASLARKKAELAQAEKTYKATKAAYLKKPKDAKLKSAYVKATVTFGTTTMNSPTLTPKDKYPKALKLYREALKVDPNNKEAKNNAELIESIYKQMGRPIPKA
ncbi:MAG: hypothetical protein JST40_08765 [Armatimonadetes bacterium]|nr:hypothetical protein [Armatimonadota bacterium]